MNSISAQDCFVPSPLYEIAASIANSQQITAAERAALKTAFLKYSLNEEEHRLINRLHRALLQGRMKLV